MTAGDNPATLILGVGSPYGDDRAGWELIDTLRPLLDGEKSKLTILDKSDRGGALLLNKMEPYPQVILVDAMQTGATTGTIHHRQLDEIIAAAGNNLSNHGFGLANSLALGKALKQLPQQLEIYGIEMATIPQSADFDSPLSPAVQDAIKKLALELHQQVATSIQ